MRSSKRNTKEHLFLRGRGKGIQERRLRMNPRCKRIRRAWYHGKQKKKICKRRKWSFSSNTIEKFSEMSTKKHFLCILMSRSF